MLMPRLITASKLYDYTQCPHRVWRDAYGPQDEKIEEPNTLVLNGRMRRLPEPHRFSGLMNLLRQKMKKS